MRSRIAALIAAVVTMITSSAGMASAQPAETGTIRGTVSLSSGGPVFPPGQVEVFTASGILLTVGHVSAGSGEYQVDGLQPGDYKLRFSLSPVSQWAHQKLTFAEADAFTVTAGGVTVVDETMLRPGGIRVTVTDSATGRPVDNVCAQLDFGPPRCGAPGGVLELEEIRSGEHTVDLSPSDGLHARTRLEHIQVVLGQTTPVTATMRPTAAITTTVLDARTNQPSAGACVFALVRKFGALPEDRCISSDSNGRVLIGELPDENYQLLVIPEFGTGLGAQWVGPRTGTGDQREAMVVRARAGRSSTVHPVRLDPGGTIAGTIRDATTGEPVRHGNFCASLLPGEVFGVNACTDPDGRYELTQVGPYRWPLLFNGPWYSTYAWQWSGGAADRYAADPVAVTAGQTTVLDANLVPAGQITGRTLNADGTVFFGSGDVRSFNTRTGDQAGPVGFTSSGTYTVTGFSSQRVKLEYLAEGNRTWYDRASTFAEATPVRVRTGRTTTGIDLIMPTT